MFTTFSAAKHFHTLKHAIMLLGYYRYVIIIIVMKCNHAVLFCIVMHLLWFAREPKSPRVDFRSV